MEEPSGAMEPWCGAEVRGQGPQGPRVPGASRSRSRALLLLLLLLLPRRPAGERIRPRRPPRHAHPRPPLTRWRPSTGYLAAGASPGTLSTTVPTGPGVSCGSRGICPSGRLRLPRQAQTNQTTTAPPNSQTMAPLKTVGTLGMMDTTGSVLKTVHSSNLPCEYWAGEVREF